MAEAVLRAADADCGGREEKTNTSQSISRSPVVCVCVCVYVWSWPGLPLDRLLRALSMHNRWSPAESVSDVSRGVSGPCSTVERLLPTPLRQGSRKKNYTHASGGQGLRRSGNGETSSHVVWWWGERKGLLGTMRGRSKGEGVEACNLRVGLPGRWFLGRTYSHSTRGRIDHFSLGLWTARRPDTHHTHHTPQTPYRPFRSRPQPAAVTVIGGNTAWFHDFY